MVEWSNIMVQYYLVQSWYGILEFNWSKMIDLSECEIKSTLGNCSPVDQHPFFLHPGRFTIRAGDDLVFKRVNHCQGSKVRFTKSTLLA